MQSEYNLLQLKQLATKLAQNAKKQDIFALYGDLGVGKTTFARYFINSLIASDVSSPTFNLVNLYDTDCFTIWHFDLYRLNHLDEVYELGIEEALTNGVAIIEWPQIISEILPKDTMHINIITTNDESKRIISIDSQ